MIRTLAEVHADRVTVTVTLDDSLSGRLYTAEEVGDFQASEAELVAGPLRRRVAELEKTLAESRELVDFKTRVADEIDQDRNTERIRGNNLAQRLAQAEIQRDRHVATLNEQEARHATASQQYAQSLAARDRLLAAATTRVRAAKEILGTTAVSRARDEIVTSKGAVLADAIRDALAALNA